MTLVFKEWITEVKKSECWGIKKSELAVYKALGHSNAGGVRKLELVPAKKV